MNQLSTAQANFNTPVLYSQKVLDEIAALRPIDDLFMRKLFRENPDLTQFVLRMITNIPDLQIISVETQADFRQISESRSIILDVFARDSENRLYNLEIQRSDNGASPKRARYHASCIDTDSLKSGEDFDKLPDTYVIFITENDYHDLGAPVYIFKRFDKDTGITLKDGSYILYVNGSYQKDDPIGHLMHDFMCSEPDQMYYQEFSQATRPYKEMQKGEAAMGSVIERLLKEGKAEGLAEGRSEGKIEALKNLMSSLNLSADKAMEILGISGEEKAQLLSRL